MVEDNVYRMQVTGIQLHYVCTWARYLIIRVEGYGALDRGTISTRRP